MILEMGNSTYIIFPVLSYGVAMSDITSCFHFLRSLAILSACFQSIFMFANIPPMSSFHVLVGFSLLRFPSFPDFQTLFPFLLSFILTICPNHVSRIPSSLSNVGLTLLCSLFDTENTIF